MEPAAKPPTGRKFKVDTVEDIARLLLEPDVDTARAWQSIRSMLWATAMTLQMGAKPSAYEYIDDGKDSTKITLVLESKRV